MSTLKKIERVKNKPIRLICKEGDYTASFATIDEAYAAKNRHQEKFDDHKVVIISNAIEFEDL